MMTKKQEYKQHSRQARDTIKLAAGYTDEDYHQLFFETGCKFAEYLFSDERELITCWLTDASLCYWKWWSNEWRNQENILISEYQHAPFLQETSEINAYCESFCKNLIRSKGVIDSFTNWVKYLYS